MKSIHKELKLAAAKDLVWFAWMKEERITKFFAPKARIVPEVNGAYELFFDPTNPDSMSTKGCKLLEIEPNRRFVFSWKGPDNFAAIMNDEGNLTKVEVTLEEDGNGTRLTLLHTGWGEGEEWEKAYKWHVMAWDQVLESLKKAIESGEGELCCQP